MSLLPNGKKRIKMTEIAVGEFLDKRAINPKENAVILLSIWRGT